MDRRAVDSQLLHQLYGYVLSRKDPVARVADFATVYGGSAEEAEELAEQLLAMGLLAHDPRGGLVAISPDEAVARRVSPLEREMRARRSLIERRRGQLMSFLPVFEASLSDHQSPGPFEVIESLPAALTAIEELAAGCEDEVFTAQPGGARAADILEEAAPRDEAILRRGIRMRVLYQHTARFSPGTNVYVERISRLGGQVRTLDDRFTRMLVFDRKTAVIAVPGNPNAAAIVREPSMVAFIVDTCQRLWLIAQPFTAESSSHAEIESNLREAIVRMLTEGMTDSSIALRLGMSVRTCRRHIADLMTDLKAQSRFQAGYALAMSQLLNTDARADTGER